jgi:cell division protease FtsH
MIITEKEKEVTAYHEAGHALVARLLPDTDPIHKVTIIPRGRALGLTMQLPIDEKYTHSKKFLENTICILFGGRIAEQIIFGEITTGAGNDLERATDLARRMVCEWGMSEELGPLTYGKKEEQIFLGREIAQHRDFSEETARQIDVAVKKIILQAKDTVIALLEEHKDILTRMAEELLERETIILDDIEKIMTELHPEKFPLKEKPVKKSSSTVAAVPEPEAETAAASSKEPVLMPSTVEDDSTVQP